jgi:hypothetical protein
MPTPPRRAATGTPRRKLSQRRIKRAKDSRRDRRS